MATSATKLSILCYHHVEDVSVVVFQEKMHNPLVRFHLNGKARIATVVPTTLFLTDQLLTWSSHHCAFVD